MKICSKLGESVTSSAFHNTRRAKLRPSVTLQFPAPSESVTNPKIDNSWTWGRVKHSDTALPLDWLLTPKSATKIDRILAELVRKEAHEANPHFKSDYRQTWHAFYLADVENSPIPFVEASYRVLGCHPDKVWPRTIANRQALLGKEYSKWYDAEGMPLPAEISPDCQQPRKTAESSSRTAVPCTDRMAEDAGTIPKKPSESVGKEDLEKSA